MHLSPFEIYTPPDILFLFARSSDPPRRIASGPDWRTFGSFQKLRPRRYVRHLGDPNRVDSGKIWTTGADFATRESGLFGAR